MLPCTSVGPREVDDTHYEASEEASICEMESETTAVRDLDLAIPIPEATMQPRSISEPMPTRETWSGKRTALCPHAVLSLTGYSTSENEELEIGGKASATRRKVRKTRAGQRRASWSPQPPLTPRARDSGVQGLDDSDTCTAGSVDGNGDEAARHWRKITELDVLDSILVGSEDEDEDEGSAFRGIADADSSEERWRQIVLEEHMDKIFHALLTLLDEELKETVVDGVLVRASFETKEEWGIPRRKQTGVKERLLTLVRLFGYSRARKAGVL
jgi:hypothetical protein